MASARGYGDLKAAAAEAVIAELTPIRERYAELRPDESALEATLAQGAEPRARSRRRRSPTYARRWQSAPRPAADPCARAALTTRPAALSPRAARGRLCRGV